MKIFLELQVEVDFEPDNTIPVRGVYLERNGSVLDISEYLSPADMVQVHLSCMAEAENQSQDRRDLKDIRGDMARDIQRDEMAERARQRGVR